MSDAGSQTEKVALAEHWVARALEDVSISEVPRQALAHFEDRRVSLNVVAATDAGDRWLWYSAAAAKREAVFDDRLAPLVASGRLDGAFYVAYDVGKAVPLAAYREQTEMSTAQSLQLLWTLARALDAAVANGILPVEVTPDSVFVDLARGAVLADLGVARAALGNPPAAIDVNAPWVAPEILLDGEPHERSAVYSYGALMYTLMTGAPPHSGHPDEIVAAAPPSVREVRPDLPEALDLVISTAMARDPRRRYRSASEARSLAHLVLQDSLAQPESKPKLRIPLRLPERQPREPRERRRTEPPARAARSVPRAALLVVGAALAAGVVGGVLLSGGDEAPAAKPVRVVNGDLAITAPGGWQSAPAAAGTLVAHPEGDPASGLTLERVDSPVETGEQATPVRVGKVEAWRDSGAQVAGGATAVRYVIPTASGKLVATCRASRNAEPGTLGQCERALSTLRLPAATSLPLADVVESQQRWEAAVARLSEQRAGARRALATAERPAGQLLAAQALARVHERAATRFAALPGGADVAAASRRTAAAYEALARAAGTDSASRWNAARERVRRSEAALRRAIAAA